MTQLERFPNYLCRCGRLLIACALEADDAPRRKLECSALNECGRAYWVHRDFVVVEEALHTLASQEKPA